MILFEFIHLIPIFKQNIPNMKRRKFIGVTALGTAGAASSFYIPGIQTNQKIKIGLIGAGWYGMVITTAALKSGQAEVTGVCDIDSAHLKASADEIEKLQGFRPKTFKFYQELIDMPGLQALFIGTIPHWHALQFIEGCRKGLSIYCEKPLSYDVAEGIAMVNAWKKAGNIVQVGFQRRQAVSYQKTKELIDSGRIGELRQVTAQIHYNPGPQDTKIQAPPPSLDWEQWCGPAPKLDYRPSIGHRSWRLEKEYGNGHLVDWGIHHIDIIRKILSETMPQKFYTTGGIFSLKGQITTPDTLTAYLGFKRVPVTWTHRLWGNGDVTREFNNGIFFYGEKGSIFVDDAKIAIFPTGREATREDIPVNTPMMQDNHVINFLEAVKKNDKALVSCNPEDAFMSTATVQMAMISYYSGTEVTWDELKKEITGNPQASKLLKREYREGYVHP
jgi:predicted dehydrogenase